MIAKVQKWGNSLALRIPKGLAAETRVKYGSEVDLTVERDRLVIRPVRARRYHLKTLLAGVTRNNLHAEVHTDDAVGLEQL